MTKMMIYVQPSMYEDSTLSHAIDTYMVAVEQDLGWVVKKSRLDDFNDWRNVRAKLISDDYDGVLLVGQDIDYPCATYTEHMFAPTLAPFMCDEKPEMHGKKVISYNYCTVRRGVCILRGDEQELANIFKKFSQRHIKRYKNVSIFAKDMPGECTDEQYSIPQSYNFQHCINGSRSDFGKASKLQLTLLGLSGHAGPKRIDAAGMVYLRDLYNVEMRILLITGCWVGGWFIHPSMQKEYFGKLVFINPHLHLVLAGGTGAVCSVVHKKAIPEILRGKTFVEAFKGKRVDHIFTPYGDPAFHLSEEFADGLPPVTPPPPKKSVITFKSEPSGAELRLTKR